MSAMFSGRKAAAACLALAMLLAGCHRAPLPARPAPLRVGATVTNLSAGGAKTKVLQPQSPGTETYSGGGATMDVSNAAEGYVTIRYSGSAAKVKVQITASGKNTYTYNLSTGGNYEVFPLTCGDGQYRINVLTHLQGDYYTEALGHTVNVKLRNQMLPFLYPSQYVNFSSGTRAVKLSGDLAKNAENDLAVVTSVYNYVIQNVAYDTDKANRALRGEINGYLAVVDNTLSSGRGICLDYAALMTAMLRAQQIPTRLEVGYVSTGAYHAWISTYIQDVGWVNGVIYFDGKSWKLMDPTFAASGGADIMQFIGDGSNYQRQYMY